MGRRLRIQLLQNLLFVVVVPGVVAGAVPALITRWAPRPWGPWPLILVTATLLIGAGTGFLLHAVLRFATEGRGSPAPVAPTEQLVLSGAYRHVRNPMYLAVAAVIGGQALISPSLWIVLYLAAFVAATAAFVRAHEEPTLLAAHGETYARYRQAVPAWRPRLRPWNG